MLQVSLEAYEAMRQQYERQLHDLRYRKVIIIQGDKVLNIVKQYETIQELVIHVE